MTWDLSSNMLIAVLLASVRAAAWLVICPPFNTKWIPVQIKVLLAVAIAFAVSPVLAGQVPPLEPGALLVSAAEQVVVGAALGFLTALLFAAVQAAGNMIDLLGGFSMASAFDPLSGASTSVFGRFYNLLAVTLLFASQGHQLILHGFARSYRSLPLEGTLSLETLQALLTSGLTQMFLAALQIAGPLIAVLFLADVGLGLLNRVAPALNAFSIGFPIKILVTIGLVGLALAGMPGIVGGIVERAVEAVMRAGGG
jgi:flagellar biosynthetic protein FliR